ncbi:hypothetical protein TNIN_367521 [Trichonephila inaurata madagascariensis]|uniref:Uncharacterized protein n=1 Tax=Trichonephila inaurata madagascariensis TaxID=2747483 RepID=A0A8X6YJP4_9ARAC|nr:hypothetical protein TNIN_367521 [Trichonephila inaurata madagascariensis]
MDGLEGQLASCRKTSVQNDPLITACRWPCLHFTRLLYQEMVGVINGLMARKKMTAISHSQGVTLVVRCTKAIKAFVPVCKDMCWWWCCITFLVILV